MDSSDRMIANLQMRRDRLQSDIDRKDEQIEKINKDKERLSEQIERLDEQIFRIKERYGKEDTVDEECDAGITTGSLDASSAETGGDWRFAPKMGEMGSRHKLSTKKKTKKKTNKSLSESYIDSL